MVTQSLPSPARSRSLELLAIVLAAALALGVIVSLGAFLLARYGPAGGSWSFRGNGALAAYSLVPAFLAGGWTAVVLHHRGRPWAGLAVGAGAVGVTLAGIDAVLLPVFGPGADQAVGPVALLALAAWSVAAPLLAMLLSRGARAPVTSTAISIAAAVLWAIGLGAGIALAGMAFPAGS